MKAFRVSYKVPGSITAMTVLSTSDQNIEKFVAEKDDNFQIEDRWCEIQSIKELPLSNIMIKDLSAIELLRLLGKIE